MYRVQDAQSIERDAKARIAHALRRRIDDLFGGNLSRAAERLGYKKQRLHSYMSQTSFPSAEVFDKIKEEWALDLLNIDGIKNGTAEPQNSVSEAYTQLSLFEHPVTLSNEGVQITLERRGAAIAVGITISPDVKVA